MKAQTAKPSIRKYPLSTLIVVALASLVAGFLLGTQVGAPSPTPNAPQAEAQAPNAEPTRFNISEDDDPAIGPEDAPVVIIEFSDYQCPYCKRWHDEVFFRLLEAYGDQIRFVYRDFPLSAIHPFAASAAEAANCAREQDAYWEYHNALFSEKYGFSREAFEQYAAELALDMPAFIDCLDTRRYQEEVEADYREAAALGVNSTPTFFINGRPVIGAQPYEVFVTIIEEELANAAP